MKISLFARVSALVLTTVLLTTGGMAATAAPGAKTGSRVVATAVSTTASTTGSTMTSSQPKSSARLRFGVSTPGGASANAELDAVASMLGEDPSIVLSYKDFAQAAPISALKSVDARGAISLLTWEPWKWGGGVNQPAYASAHIIAGDFDPYLKQWGAALAAWGKPVMLRYAHEMNGDWYPWADGVNGNEVGSYAAAWRHVHDVLLSQGATNIIWVWSPNIPYYGSTAFSTVYPGSAYADVVALDGYNWGTTMASGWRSPSTLFSAGLTQLRAVAPGKEIVIAETGSAENGGSKGAWNTALVSYLAAQSDVTGFVWFDQNKGADWRIDTSADSVSALKAALLARNP